MANQALITQLVQLANQLNALQKNVATLQTSNTTLSTRTATLEAENATLTTANMTLLQLKSPPLVEVLPLAVLQEVVQKLPPVIFAATSAMINHQDLINYSTQVGTMIYGKGCEKLTTEFDMKSNKTVVYITKLQVKCVKMGWHMGTQQIINLTNTLLALPSKSSTSMARSMPPSSRPNARFYARAREPCSSQEPCRTTQ